MSSPDTAATPVLTTRRRAFTSRRLESDSLHATAPRVPSWDSATDTCVFTDESPALSTRKADPNPIGPLAISAFQNRACTLVPCAQATTKLPSASMATAGIVRLVLSVATVSGPPNGVPSGR